VELLKLVLKGWLGAGYGFRSQKPRADGVDGPTAQQKWWAGWLHNSGPGPVRERQMSEKTQKQALQPWPGNDEEIAVV